MTKEEWDAIGVDNLHEDCLHATERNNRIGKARGNVHPTVKSYRLMHWLHSLTGAKRIGDLCGGSGTGMFTAHLDGIDWIGAEMCPEAIVIANARLAFWKGLSFEARRAIIEDDIVPQSVTTDERQRGLFDALM